MDVGEYPFDLVRKEKGEAEGRWDAQQRGAGVDSEELPEGHPGDPGREEGRRPDPHHVSGGEHDLHTVFPERRLDPLLPSSAQDPSDGTPVEDPLPPVVADPVEDDVAGQRARDAEGQGEPPPQDRLVGQDRRDDDRCLLRDGGSQAPGEEDEEQPGVPEILYKRLDQIAPREDSARGRR